jgi:hypothetical protein
LLSSRAEIIVNADKDAGKKESLHTVDGNVN